MNKSILTKLLIILAGVGSVAFCFVMVFYNWQKEGAALSKEYPYLKKADTLNNFVESSFYPSDWRGETVFQMVTLDNGKKYTISAECMGDESLQDVLNEVVVKIKKKKDNDTIFVNARSGEYIFIRFDID